MSVINLRLNEKSDGFDSGEEVQVVACLFGGRCRKLRQTTQSNLVPGESWVIASAVHDETWVQRRTSHAFSLRAFVVLLPSFSHTSLRRN